MLCFYQGFIIIIILLLNVIRAEQKNKIKKLLGTYLIYIYFKTISAAMLDNIYIGKYIYILLSLKLLASKKFYNILTGPIFYMYIELAIVNKIHLVTNQGRAFQSAYIMLYKVWLLLGLKLWFIYTATLNNKTLKII